MPSILLVDDEKNILTTLSLALKRNHFQVQVARNGPEALRILDNHPIDYVISDVRMKPMNGYQLAQKIHDKYNRIQIVLMSAYGFEEENPNLPKIESLKTFTKPFDIEALLSFIKTEDVSMNCRKKITLIGENEEIEGIEFQLVNAGFNVSTIHSKKKKTSIDICDLFLLDARILSSDRWTILNRIDQAAPGVPVVLITDNTINEKVRNGLSQIAVSMIDRQKFINKPNQALKMIDSIIG